MTSPKPPLTPEEAAALTDEEWRERLTPEEYEVMRQKGTERAFSGELTHNKASGEYRCAGCGALLFTSEAKFDSGTGWPSFTDPAAKENLRFLPDHSHGMNRTEVQCAACGAHLGHVFDDGPGASGKRYCINSCSLDFAADSNDPPAAGGRTSGAGHFD